MITTSQRIASVRAYGEMLYQQAQKRRQAAGDVGERCRTEQLRGEAFLLLQEVRYLFRVARRLEQEPDRTD